MVRSLRARALPAAEIASALRHIAACPECAAMTGDDVVADASRVRDLLEAEASEPPRHLTEEELFAWVDGSVEPSSLDAVRSHLEECDLCRADVADLQPLRERSRPRRRWTWAAAAAAIILIAVIILMWPRRDRTAPVIVHTPPPTPAPHRVPPPSPPSRRYAKPEWSALVAGVLASGRLPHRTDIAWLRGGPETLRGEETPATGTFTPSGVVIDTTRPELSWPRVEGATYVVSIFDGLERVDRSAPRTLEHWKPSQPLRRGRVYTWQVEASSPRGSQLLPAPPTPPARFLVLGEREHEEIVDALRQHPDDHLLLAALYARAGMESEAQEELNRIARSPDPAVQRLRQNERTEQ